MKVQPPFTGSTWAPVVSRGSRTRPGGLSAELQDGEVKPGDQPQGLLPLSHSGGHTHSYVA